MLLQQLGNVNDDSTLLTSVKAAICKDLGTRYSDEGIRLFLLESSCLDPRFKAMPYLNDEERRNVFDSLADKVEKINLQKSIKTQIKEEKIDDDKLPCAPALPCLLEESAPDSAVQCISETTVECKSPQEKPKSALNDLFGEVFVTKVEPAMSLNVRVQHEIVNYRSEESMPLDSNPLKWWEKHEFKYPLLSTLAKKYLCIPATSVASERVFSTAGDFVTAQRSCLSCSQVDRLIFLKKNLQFDINNN